MCKILGFHAGDYEECRLHEEMSFYSVNILESRVYDTNLTYLEFHKNKCGLNSGANLCGMPSSGMLRRVET
jgi:hypothetical protein